MGDILLKWDAVGEHLYETGVDKGVFYPLDANKEYRPGEVWNGLTAVNEQPSGAEATGIYADNIKYLNLLSAETFAATVEAYTYPDGFGICDGSAAIAEGVTIGQQDRTTFGLCYRTIIGNDVANNAYGYKLHLVYGCVASPSERSNTTVNESPEAAQFSWTVNTTPVPVTGKKPTATLLVDSTKVDATKLAKLEAILYGVEAADFSDEKTYAVGDFVTHEDKVYKCVVAVSTAGEWNASNWEESNENQARLPLPDEVADIFAEG